mgnify:CR=1 FL=1
MRVLYQPQGRAGEYGELAVNLYTGHCPHKCLYCYVAGALRTTRENWLKRECKPRPDLLSNLKKDLASLALAQGDLWADNQADKPQVFMCFTCDPYPVGIDTMLTRQVIEGIHSYGFGVRMLTKGGMRAARDFDLLGPVDAFASTLTFVNDYDSLAWEPGAALPDDRMQAIKMAHAKGIETWASLEPVIDPEQSLEIIRQTHEYVSLYKIGTWNHDARAKAINWADFGRRAIDLLESLGKARYIKQDLREKIPDYGQATTAR